MKLIIFMMGIVVHIMMLFLMLRFLGHYYARDVGTNPALQKIRQFTRPWLILTKALPGGRLDYPSLALMILLAAGLALLKGVMHPLAIVLIVFYELFTSYCDVLIYCIIFMSIYEAIAPQRPHPYYDLAERYSLWIMHPLQTFLPPSRSFNWSYLVAIILIMILRFVVSHGLVSFAG